MKVDENFLVEVGLAEMPENDKVKFANFVAEEIEVRVGERISKGMMATQMNEFDSLKEPLEIRRWLEKNRPDYREIVTRTIQEMKEEIRANRMKILA